MKMKKRKDIDSGKIGENGVKRKVAVQPMHLPRRSAPAKSADVEEAASDQSVLGKQLAEEVDAQPNQLETCLEPGLGTATANLEPGEVKTQTGKQIMNPEPGTSTTNDVADVPPLRRIDQRVGNCFPALHQRSLFTPACVRGGRRGSGQ
ncbi:unnamed protein product [Linum trigynum]|uniref:Uncharacterized protein n=1 Tax=Linum trigynum TaxID=586398 RepID=A0AAV2CGA9_9ROSI